MSSLPRIFSQSPITTVPLFLAPAFARPAASTATASFSRCYASKATKGTEKKDRPNWALHLRPKIDRNKKRGVSAIRRTGPKSTRGLWKYPLPLPVARDHRTTAPLYQGSENHGLWGFFDKTKQAMIVPEEESSHGRPWTYKELSVKSFNDLHKLYWVCVKEQNRTLTREKERERSRAGYGGVENEERVNTIRETMTLIRQVLVDRQLSYEQAHFLVRQEEIVDIFQERASLADAAAFEEGAEEEDFMQESQASLNESGKSAEQVKPLSA